MRNAFFTPQRHRLARARMEGASYEEIAHQFGISVNTVQFHFNLINRVLGINRPAQFFAAYRNYLLSKWPDRYSDLEQSHIVQNQRFTP